MGTLITIIFVYIIYYIFTINRYDKTGHYKNKKDKKSKKKLSPKDIKELKKLDHDKLPAEVKVFVDMYKIDLDKINIRALLKLNGLILGIEIALIAVTMAMIFNNNITISIIVGFISLMIIYLVSLKLLANNFKKRGLVKDE